MEKVMLLEIAGLVARSAVVEQRDVFLSSSAHVPCTYFGIWDCHYFQLCTYRCTVDKLDT